MHRRCAGFALAIALLPVVILGAFGGTSFLAHSHDGHGAHLHASTSVADVRLSADQHRFAHEAGVATCGAAHGDHGSEGSNDLPPEHDRDTELPAPADESDGFIVTIPDHDQLAERGSDLAIALRHATMLHDVVEWLWMQPGMAEEAGAPGGPPNGSRPHVHAGLTAGQRLLRTSMALLI